MSHLIISILRRCGLASVAVATAVSANPVAAESIRDAVQRSFANSDARKVAITSIAAQNRSVAIAQGERGISVDLSGELAIENVDDETVIGSKDGSDTELARRISLTASYPLLDGMRSLNTLYREATLLDAEIIKLADAAETIALNAVQAYVDVYRRQLIAQISRENIAVHRKIAEQVDAQVDAGKLSEPDRFQASDKLLAARLAHADARASLSDALSTYQFVIGTAPRSGLSLRATTPAPGSQSAAVQTALQNSFLVRIAQKDIEALKYQSAAQLADWQPQLDLFLSGAFEEDVEGETGSETTLKAGVRLNWTLYKGGTKNETIARARDLEMRAYYRKKQVEDEVRNLARKSWNAYAAAVERKTLLDTTVANNIQIVDAFKREFEAAKRPLLQVLDAERALFNLKVRQANAQAAVAFQRYRILASQSQLARHFGLPAYGGVLAPEFEARVRAAPRDGFNVTLPPLE